MRNMIPTIASTRSLIELLHPHGLATRVIGRGSALPVGVTPSTVRQGQAVDLALLAPNTAECRRPDWLAKTAQEAAAQLAEDGLVYILAPPRCRGQARRALEALGLRVTMSLIHVPDSFATRYLIPVERRGLRYALDGTVPAARRSRAALGLLLGLPGAERLLTQAVPTVGLAFQRPEAPPPLAWADRAFGQPVAVAVLGAGPRADAATAMLHGLDPENGVPTAMFKVGLNPGGGERLIREAGALRLLGAGARRAGAQVPEALLDVRGGPVLIQSALAGRLAAPRLAGASGRAAELLAQLGGWLERWGRLTRTNRTVDAAWIERELLGPLAAVAPQLPGAYLARVTELGRRCLGRAVPLTATHRDLTMWNVLLAPGGSLGIVDWESARPADFPGGDLLYAAVDVAAASAGYVDRLAAFQDCFIHGGRWAAQVRAQRERLAVAIGADGAWQAVCFHACWIGHAANELARGGPGPFVEIVCWLAKHSGPELEWGDGR